MRDKLNDPARLRLMQEAISNIEEFLANVQDYYTVNLEMVWTIIQDDLPTLKEYLLLKD